MGLTPVGSTQTTVKYHTSPVRPDILHACDIGEEIGIGYGFNNIPMVYPTTSTIGAFIPENKFTDLLRHEVAQAGYTECLTFSLTSIEDSYYGLLSKEEVEQVRSQPGKGEGVMVENEKSKDFEMVRTSLAPGLLKVLQSNQDERIPQKIFEINDVCKLDSTTDTGARNERKVCVMQLNSTASFEVIHGVLGLVMSKVGAEMGKDYYLKESNQKQNPQYFEKRGADVMLRGSKIGSIGVLHPEVIGAFGLKNPVSVVELDF